MNMANELIERLRETASDIFMNLDADFPVCKADGKLMLEAADAIEKLSVKGRWAEKNKFPNWQYCSNCGEPWTFDSGVPPYCPNCGAKMVELQESEELE